MLVYSSCIRTIRLKQQNLSSLWVVKGRDRRLFVLFFKPRPEGSDQEPRPEGNDQEGRAREAVVVESGTHESWGSCCFCGVARFVFERVVFVNFYWGRE